jgi:hypothetical protein
MTSNLFYNKGQAYFDLGKATGLQVLDWPSESGKQ